MFPRRNRVDLMVKAERMIFDAVGEVETMGCDTKLTDAVVLLSKARGKIADYVDEQNPSEMMVEMFGDES